VTGDASAPNQAPAPDRQANNELWRQALLAMGAPEEEVRAAHTEEQLLLLAIDTITGGGDHRYTLDELEELTGVDRETLRTLYRALGVPEPPPDERAFTSDDVAAMRIVNRLLSRSDFDAQVVLQMTRVVGSAMARVAEAQVSAALQQVRDGNGMSEPDTGILTEMPTLLAAAWRRQMRTAARRHMDLDGEPAPARTVSVGFADLVGFTALSQQLDESALAAMVDRFEGTAYDVVGQLGGRVVKMIGDEVMFAVDGMRAAVEVALTLSETYHDDESLSDVRVGLACGPVLEREGDLYGPTVNLASRVVSIAYAGSVVVSDEIHEELQDDDSLVWRSLRARHLKDLGRVRLWTVRRAGDGFEREGPVERARRRRDSMRSVVNTLTDRL
jgi:adenylate cyclase